MSTIPIWRLLYLDFIVLTLYTFINLCWPVYCRCLSRLKSSIQISTAMEVYALTFLKSSGALLWQFLRSSWTLNHWSLFIYVHILVFFSFFLDVYKMSRSKFLIIQDCSKCAQLPIPLETWNIHFLTLAVPVLLLSPSALFEVAIVD
jgi:hypothetical protein